MLTVKKGIMAKENLEVDFIKAWKKVVLESAKRYEETKQMNLDDMRKIIFYGIKDLVSKINEIDSMNLDNVIAGLNFVDVITKFVEKITPREFMTIFPISKHYDGKKYCIQDYYSTMEFINEIGIDNVIADADDFLMEYDNKDVRDFMIGRMLLVSRYYRLKGKKSPVDRILDNVFVGKKVQ